MPHLFHNPYPVIINALPVANHCVPVVRTLWHPRFLAANQLVLWDAIFGHNEVIHISRDRLLNFPYQSREQKCAEILLWGYPSNMRGIVTNLLPQLTFVAECATANRPWPGYLHAFPRRCRLSTISKLAYFHHRNFDGLNALILDQRLINNIPNWVELNNHLQHLNYQNAPINYLRYLNIMHATAENHVLQCAPDQLELFLFTLGNCFYP